MFATTGVIAFPAAGSLAAAVSPEAEPRDEAGEDDEFQGCLLSGIGSVLGWSRPRSTKRSRLQRGLLATQMRLVPADVM